MSLKLTRETIIAKLELLLATPPLKLSAEGGGIPEKMTLEFELPVLISRGELEDVVRLLRDVTFGHGSCRYPEECGPGRVQ